MRFVNNNRTSYTPYRVSRGRVNKKDTSFRIDKNPDTKGLLEPQSNTIYTKNDTNRDDATEQITQ